MWKSFKPVKAVSTYFAACLDNCMKYNFVTIEGNIGAGKTTLAHLLSKHFNARLILEEFADNPFLPKFYDNPGQYAFPLELFFMAEH